MTEIGMLAQDVIETEFDFLSEEEKNVAISRASGWMLSNLGKLNTLINTSYSGENPGLKLEENSIYKNLYISNYYKNKASSVLKNMDSDNLQWISLREGDSQIQVQNKNEVAKTYLQMQKEKDLETKDLIAAYNLYGAYPREVSVDYDLDYSETNDSEFEVMGFVDIPFGTKEVFIPLDLKKKPERISVTLVKPSNQNTYPNFSYSIIGNSISETGFAASLGATVNYTGYKINYGIK